MLQNIYSIFRLLYEILTLFIFGYWGFQFRSLGGWRYVIGIAAAAAIMFVWGFWGSPAAPQRLQGAMHFILELAIYLAAAVCLYFTGQKYWAIAYGLVGVANVIIHHVWLTGVNI